MRATTIASVSRAMACLTFLVLALSAGFLATPPAAGQTIGTPVPTPTPQTLGSLDFGLAPTIKVGDTFSLDIVINPVDSPSVVRGVQFGLTYDPQLLQVDDNPVAPGLYFRSWINAQPPPRPGLLTVGWAPTTPGTITAGGMALSGGGLSGPTGTGQLATVTFKALAAGTTTVSLTDSRISYLDTETDMISGINARNGFIQLGIGQPAPTPLPTPTSVPGPFVLSGTVSSTSGPVAGVVVTADLGGTTLQLENTTTDTSGAYALTLGAATYDLTFFPPVGANLHKVVQSAVALDQNTTLNVTLPQASVTVSGHVVGLTGAPASNVTVSYAAAAASGSVSTDTNGDYVFTAPDGGLMLNVAANASSGDWPPQLSVHTNSVPIGSDTTLDLDARGLLVPVSVHAQDQANAPIGNVSVTSSSPSTVFPLPAPWTSGRRRRSIRA